MVFVIISHMYDTVFAAFVKLFYMKLHSQLNYTLSGKIMLLIRLRKFPCIPSLLRIFIKNRCELIKTVFYLLPYLILFC